jgi:hypothetical protein
VSAGLTLAHCGWHLVLNSRFIWSLPVVDILVVLVVVGQEEDVG